MNKRLIKRLIKRIIFPSIAFFVGFFITLTHVAAQEVPSKLQQDNNLSQPNGQPDNFFNFHFWIFVVFFLIAIFCLANFIKNRHCPQCKTFNLKRTQQVLVPATTSYSGRRRVICHCQNCSYHHEYEQNIPVISNDYSGGGGNDYGGTSSNNDTNVTTNDYGSCGGNDYGGGGGNDYGGTSSNNNTNVTTNDYGSCGGNDYGGGGGNDYGSCGGNDYSGGGGDGGSCGGG
ncbi:MAG: hypothetical protein KME46_04815 [Brasilonema angustatum HA4187-MV1]|jgi:hypothetical protein|nr:hypothetical protein [Brasilonema angustatum HA4187-MV1]